MLTGGSLGYSCPYLKQQCVWSRGSRVWPNAKGSGGGCGAACLTKALSTVEPAAWGEAAASWMATPLMWSAHAPRSELSWQGRVGSQLRVPPPTCHRGCWELLISCFFFYRCLVYVILVSSSLTSVAFTCLCSSGSHWSTFPNDIRREPERNIEEQRYDGFCCSGLKTNCAVRNRTVPH